MTPFHHSFRIAWVTLLLTAGLPASIADEGRRWDWTTKERLSLCRFLAKGDKAYSKGQFSEAWKIYWHVPQRFSMRAELMAGESQLRLLVMRHQEHQRTLPPGQCAALNDGFGSYMGQTYDNYYRTPLTLADRESTPSPRMAALYQHSRKVAACLKALEAEYTAKPASACVDLTALAACLGPPLKL